MKEQKNIVAAFQKVQETKQLAALATVVKVRGSSYRSPGARMLITDDGRWVGSISGGCLEGDALRKARMVMSSHKPITVTYDTREESNQNLGVGLGCNGLIDVFIEPIDAHDEFCPINLFRKIINVKEPVALATVFKNSNSEELGRKVLIDRSGQILFNSFLDIEAASMVIDDLNKLFDNRRSEVKSYSRDNELEVFLELIEPTVSLIIFGGGFDARPVSHLAKSLGWNVTVTDECVSHIAPVFFPSADTLSLCQRQFIDRDFNITPYTACVLMSHNYEYDRDVFMKLLKTEAPYIGILGPRKRFDKMCSELLKIGGVMLSDHNFHRIHSPIGLDIGAETPDEIAVSIIAEIQGKFANRSGGFLKYNPGPIHQRDLKTDQVFKQVYLGIEKQSKSVNE
jgi:xanthine dehydrogenase accessory factor